MSATEHPRYQELVSLLNSTGDWRQLANVGDQYGTTLSPMDLQSANLARSPADFLIRRLFHLLGEPCSADELADILEVYCDLEDAAEIIRPPLPLTVRQLAATNGATVWTPLGGVLTLECEAGGRPPPSYQWLQDGVPLPGQTSECLTVSDFSVQSLGQYSCLVSRGDECLSAGCVEVMPRAAAPLLMHRSVTGGRWNDGEEVCARPGETVTLCCEWRAWPPPTLRWEREETLISGETANTLVVKCQRGQADGRYICIATNSEGETWAEPFAIETDGTPEILTHPQPPSSRAVLGRSIELTSRAYCRRPLRAIWRKTVDDRDVLIGASEKVLTQVQENGDLLTTLTLVPPEADARTEYRVTCEFIADGDYENKVVTKPAVFRVTYPARSKMALIIGNSFYQHLERLDKVNDDVTAFRDKMQEMGFGTLLVMNLTLAKARQVVDYFMSLAQPGSYLMVLAAGHGFTHSRQDYLIPVDHREINDQQGPELEKCLSLEKLEVKLQRVQPALLVLCTDICRSTSLHRAAGGYLPIPQQHRPATTNVLRIFSTQVGQDAFDDGKFMLHLLKVIGDDITVQHVGNRTLWFEGDQNPIIEMSAAKTRSLLDYVDDDTLLNVAVEKTGKVEAVTSSGLKYFVEFVARWTNYIWVEDCRQLLLTVQLRPLPSDGSECAAQSADARLQLPSLEVQEVLDLERRKQAMRQTEKPPSSSHEGGPVWLEFEPEGRFPASMCRSWRAVNVPLCAGRPIHLLLIVLVHEDVEPTRNEPGGPPPGPLRVFLQLPAFHLDVGSRGLSAQQQPPTASQQTPAPSAGDEVKVTNTEPLQNHPGNKLSN